MLFVSWILQTILISIIIIFLIHHIISYLRDTLTVPKVKDMINIPTKQYEDMYEVIQRKKEKEEQPNFGNNHAERNTPEVEEDSNSMKNELKNYLKKQMNQPDAVETDPHSFSFSDINSLPVSNID